MNFDFMDRRSAERFAELLDESTGGRRHRTRGPADERLAELVAVGSNLSAARPAARVDTEFRTGLRAMLVATAERDGIGRTTTAAEDQSATGRPVAARTGPRVGRLGHGLLGHGGRVRARGAIVIGVAAGALAVSGISAASENASPGDALYGVKRSTERAQLAMAGSDVTRGQLSLDFARTRLAEAASMRGDDAEFGAVLDDMDADTRKGVKLLTTSAVARKDRKPLAAVDTFADRQRHTLTPVLSRLSPGNQERAQTSLSLLDSVGKRAGDLRTGLACDEVVPVGADSLGPKLRGCAANTGADVDGQSTSRPSGHSGKSTARPSTGKDTVKADPKRSTPAAVPTTTIDLDKRGQQRPPASSPPNRPLRVTPAPSTGPTGETSDRLPQNDEGLDGLLGGLIGNN